MHGCVTECITERRRKQLFKIVSFSFQLSQQVLAAQSRSLGDIRVSSETTETADAPVDKTVKDLWEVIR